MAPKKRESKSDRKRRKLEKKRMKVEQKLREIEERLKKMDLKPSEAARARTAKRPAKGGAAVSASKQAKRPMHKAEPARKKSAKRARKPAAAAKSGSRSPERRKRARQVPSALAVTGTPVSTARFSQEALPAEIFPPVNTTLE